MGKKLATCGWLPGDGAGDWDGYGQAQQRLVAAVGGCGVRDGMRDGGRRLRCYELRLAFGHARSMGRAGEGSMRRADKDGRLRI